MKSMIGSRPSTGTNGRSEISVLFNVDIKAKIWEGYMFRIKMLAVAQYFES